MPDLMPTTSPLGLAALVDVETTGFSPHTDRIIELAVYLFQFERATCTVTGIVDKYVGLQDPGRPIPRAASRVHGLYDRDVRGQSLDYGRVSEILHKAEFIIAHNAQFDRSFLTKQFEVCLHKPWLCSCKGINWKGKGFATAKLQDLLAAHDIQPTHAHRAGDDVLNTLTLLTKTSPSGHSYLAELLQAL